VIGATEGAGTVGALGGEGGGVPPVQVSAIARQFAMDALLANAAHAAPGTQVENGIVKLYAACPKSAGHVECAGKVTQKSFINGGNPVYTVYTEEHEPFVVTPFAGFVCGHMTGTVHRSETDVHPAA